MTPPSELPLTEASLTSFADLFGREDFGPSINTIEIPLIQRDYAQGRNTESVKRIRDSFIDALCNALMPNQAAIDLDFVFGDVDASGKFFPLDGQQRLTTLFLLHCYLAWQTGVDGKDQPWSRFSYATRPGAREFCHFLVYVRPEFSHGPSLWIRDQAAYLPTWENDPTIQSMLTVLDALHFKFGALGVSNFQHAYGRLIDKDRPAIRFHVLSMKAGGLSDSLYIKMNSRGKPLTPFENFKAHFEALLKSAKHHQADDFTRKVDTDWSDILWHYRGEDNLIDDEFMRYFRFITEVNAWNAGIEFRAEVRDDDLAELVYSADATNSAESVTFLYHAFDVWKDQNIKQEFEHLLAQRVTPAVNAVLMFKVFDHEGVDLFDACCRHYGTRLWSLAHTLLLYGVLTHRIHTPSDEEFPTRLRILRNIIEASDDEIRAGERNNMPKLLLDVRTLILSGDLARIGTFNQPQVANEQAKADMLNVDATLKASLYALEDHELIRGGLIAFDLTPEHFAARASAFHAIFDKQAHAESWKDLTGALLAQGDYSRRESRGSGHRLADFGTPRNDEPWRKLFRGRKAESVHPLRQPLRKLLDAVISGASLPSLASAYIANDATRKDWMYYFVKYDVMRGGASGRYTISQHGGYQVCMLDKERLSSLYYDPYLLAIATVSRAPGARLANPQWPRCFSGFETDRRTLTLSNSGLQIRCVDSGWELSGISPDSEYWPAFVTACASLGTLDSASHRLLAVAQDQGIDTTDRVQAGAAMLECVLGANL